ncbi:MAG: hypothetical protein Q9190_000860 [Brigantiaea leucoxantha]
MRHKARLAAELARVRVRRGFQSIEDLKAHLEKQNGSEVNDNQQITRSPTRPHHWPHPRWIRINTLCTSLNKQLQSTFAGYQQVESLQQLLQNHEVSDNKVLYIDKDIPNLLALSPAADLLKSSAYKNGMIILQDKASCFPAYLLDPRPHDGTFLDACAAPGNKTTHLAAILGESRDTTQRAQVWAIERDASRSKTLGNMVKLAKADQIVRIKAGQDFLRLDPRKQPWNKVGCLLLDPSCSGSGIIGREDFHVVTLPMERAEGLVTGKSKKRKRDESSVPAPLIAEQQDTLFAENSDHLASRLTLLSTFQLKLLLHAFTFPMARKITYSTCSIHAEENEIVILKALRSDAAREGQWRLLRRHEQVIGLRNWRIRGDAEKLSRFLSEVSLGAEEIAESCIRCEKGTEEGTQGFFVAAFVRDNIIDISSDATVWPHNNHTEVIQVDEKEFQDAEEDEWEGLSETDAI